jgi:hypothetical protein
MTRREDRCKTSCSIQFRPAMRSVAATLFIARLRRRCPRRVQDKPSRRLPADDAVSRMATRAAITSPRTLQRLVAPFHALRSSLVVVSCHSPGPDGKCECQLVEFRAKALGHDVASVFPRRRIRRLAWSCYACGHRSMKAICAAVSGERGCCPRFAITCHLRSRMSNASATLQPCSRSRHPTAVPVRPTPPQQCR